jgi:hypothetical protein
VIAHSVGGCQVADLCGSAGCYARPITGKTATRQKHTACSERHRSCGSRRLIPGWRRTRRFFDQADRSHPPEDEEDDDNGHGQSPDQSGHRHHGSVRHQHIYRHQCTIHEKTEKACHIMPGPLPLQKGLALGTVPLRYPGTTAPEPGPFTAAGAPVVPRFGKRRGEPCHTLILLLRGLSIPYHSGLQRMLQERRAGRQKRNPPSPSQSLLSTPWPPSLGG